MNSIFSLSSYCHITILLNSKIVILNPTSHITIISQKKSKRLEKVFDMKISEEIYENLRGVILDK